MCKSFSESPILKLNLRAAEAFGWISNIIIEEEKGSEIAKKFRIGFLANKDRRIRDVAKRTWKERNHREWAKDYLARVLAVDGKDNKQVLQAWK